jgi:ACS family sodium-dependent inorganic phosphate cotransporter
VGLLLCGPLIYRFGWPSVFYLFAVLGLVWCLFWPLVKPEEQDEIMQEVGANGTNANGTMDKPAGGKLAMTQDISAEVPWAEFFKSPPV